jgi:hypothetical protein
MAKVIRLTDPAERRSRTSRKDQAPLLAYSNLIVTLDRRNLEHCASVEAKLRSLKWPSISVLHGSGDSPQFWPFGRAADYDFDFDTNYIRTQSHQWIWIVSIWFGSGLVHAMQTVFAMRAATHRSLQRQMTR